MVTGLSYLFLHSLEYERMPNGSMSIRRGLLPRVVWSVVVACCAILVSFILAPTWLVPGLTLFSVGVAYWYLRRPNAVFDSDQRHVRLGRRRIPFEDVGQIHAIQRREEKSQNTGLGSLLSDPQLVIWFEVYSRVHGQPLILAALPGKKAATSLADELNSILAGAN